MWTAKWILDTYEGGDEEVRWDLYLSYPDLRRYFDQLEALPEKRADIGSGPAAVKPGSAWWQHCCRLVKG